MWGYSVATIIFLFFAIRLIAGGRRAGFTFGLYTAVLVGAVVVSVGWAGSIVATIVCAEAGKECLLKREFFWQLAGVLDAIRVSAWLGFVALLLTGWSKHSKRVFKLSSKGWLLTVMVIVCAVAAAILPQPMPWATSPDLEAASLAVTAFYPWLVIPIFGLALTEQLYQRTPANRKWAIKPLIIGLGGMFAFDLIIFSGAALFRQVDPAIWAARGIAHALVIFFIAVATRRNTAWTLDLFVSRDVVFQSTAILATGCYLMIVAGATYWVNFFGGHWGKTLQVAMLFAATLGLATLLLSGALRSRLKVYISKNLFSYRYEYRKEWLRFTALLGTAEQGENLYHQIVRAHADLIESVGGAIWLERGGVMREVARLNMPEVNVEEPIRPSNTTSLVSFLSRTGWVIQIDEALKFPSRYKDLVLPQWVVEQKDAWVIVPLPNPNGPELVGFVVLARSRAPIDVNWEVLDLLKTASRQAASYLAQFRAQEALVELEKFDSFNRMSAFVVHDLKNLIAQLALLLKNAERHRDNPEFQRDMLETIDHVVTRMNNLMLQLRTGTTPIEKPRGVELHTVINRVAKNKAAGDVRIEVELESEIRVLAHADRIERVIGHILQNAIEATLSNDEVQYANRLVLLRTMHQQGHAVIEIVDRGIGMTEEFVRDRLFHPFQTTKMHGMGIGMYESFQYMNSIGGSIAVVSVPSEGTKFCLTFPLAYEQNKQQQGKATDEIITAPLPDTRNHLQHAHNNFK